MDSRARKREREKSGKDLTLPHRLSRPSSQSRFLVRGCQEIYVRGRTSTGLHRGVIFFVLRFSRLFVRHTHTQQQVPAPLAHSTSTLLATQTPKQVRRSSKNGGCISMTILVFPSRRRLAPTADTQLPVNSLISIHPVVLQFLFGQQLFGQAGFPPPSQLGRPSARLDVKEGEVHKGKWGRIDEPSRSATFFESPVGSRLLLDSSSIVGPVCGRIFGVFRGCRVRAYHSTV